MLSMFINWNKYCFTYNVNVFLTQKSCQLFNCWFYIRCTDVGKIENFPHCECNECTKTALCYSLNNFYNNFFSAKTRIGVWSRDEAFHERSEQEREFALLSTSVLLKCPQQLRLGQHEAGAQNSILISYVAGAQVLELFAAASQEALAGWWIGSRGT